MIKCPCGRPFLLGTAFVEHASYVHGYGDQARELPKIKVGDHYEVPFLTVNDELEEGDVVREEDDDSPVCEECDTNTDPSLLPVHPGCECEPAGGWDAYIDSIEDDVPENWTEDEWKTWIDHLRSTHV